MDHIEEAAIEASLISKEGNGFDRTALTAAEVRFAEIIAIQCMNICLVNMMKLEQGTARDCATEIQEYFLGD